MFIHFILQVIYYVFAIIGMELFNGKVNYLGYKDNNYCGNIRLNGTDFWREKYCNNNFNNLIHALIVLFELTVVNQWQDILFYILFKSKLVGQKIGHLYSSSTVNSVHLLFVLE